MVVDPEEEENEEEQQQQEAVNKSYRSHASFAGQMLATTPAITMKRLVSGGRMGAEELCLEHQSMLEPAHEKPGGVLPIVRNESEELVENRNETPSPAIDVETVPKLAEEDKESARISEEGEDALFSFGEPCYVHAKKVRTKMWLLLGEKGIVKIGTTQEFVNASVYKLKNVIKLSYADVSH